MEQWCCEWRKYAPPQNAKSPIVPIVRSVYNIHMRNLRIKYAWNRSGRHHLLLENAPSVAA